MAQTKLHDHDVEWWPYGHMDPSTKTFQYHGNYYRAVKPEAKAYITSLVQSGLLEALSTNKFIPHTEICNLDMEGYAFTLKQETEFFNVSPHNFSPVLAKDAALMYLKLCSFLAERGFSLIDGHPYNIIIQENSKPKWCDIGSIVPLRNEHDLRGLQEFMQHFVYPLLLRAKSQVFGKISRHLFTEGCTQEEAQVFLGSAYQLGGTRKAVLHFLQELVEQIDFPWGKTLWSNYHAEYHGEQINPVLLDMNNQDFKAVHVRDAILKRLFRTLKPRHVIDFGANAGVQSMLIGQTGAEVLAMELDEQAASSCHANFSSFSPTLKLKVALTAFNPPPARTTPDLALALALTHHLYFTHHYDFVTMAAKLAQCTTDVLLTEFMPDGLGVGKPHIYPLPAGYTLEIFTRELGKYFKSIEVVEYHGFAHRKLIIARGRYADRGPTVC